MAAALRAGAPRPRRGSRCPWDARRGRAEAVDQRGARPGRAHHRGRARLQRGACPPRQGGRRRLHPPCSHQGCAAA
eukprot:1763626-Lingulodinium_polyedra.AAC.1